MTTEQAVDTAALDAWLAEHLFGQRVSRDGSRIVGLPSKQQGQYATSPNLGWRPMSAYSTTGDGMLMVLEALRERGLWVLPGLSSKGAVCFIDDSETWDDPRSYMGHVGYAEHADLPTAVSLAAKAALETEECACGRPWDVHIHYKGWNWDRGNACPDEAREK